MDPARRTGRYVEDSTTGGTVRAFVPAPLPPDLTLGLGDYGLIGEANRALVNVILAVRDRTRGSRREVA